MNLLDAAEVRTGTGNWERGWDGDARACSGIHVYLTECDPATTADVIGSDAYLDDDCGYRVIPFGIIAELDRKTIASRPDDSQWLADALRASADLPIARGLLVRQGMGITNAGTPVASDVWLGSDAAQEVPAPLMTDSAAVADAVADGRRLFFQRTLGIRPILHVNPDNVITLKDAGVIELDPTNGDERTAWGDPVVISEGYYDIPGLTATPPAFWTGPIQITMSAVNEEDVMREVRQNRERRQVSMLAAIDTPPCAIVRIGPAPVATP